MSAEQLIALEAGLGELGTLYMAARNFAALQAAAEAELLPRTSALGARLRTLLRHHAIDDVAVDAAAAEIAGLQTHWQDALAQLRASGLYQQALAASNAEDSEQLRRLLPELMFGLQRVACPPILFAPVGITAPRRSSAAGHFSTATETAERIAGFGINGIPVHMPGTDWWDSELPYLNLVANPETLDSPVALRVLPRDLNLPVFVIVEETAFRVYTPQWRVRFSIVMQPESNDEWWAAYEEPYEDFRERLRQELARRGLSAEVWAITSNPVSEP